MFICISDIFRKWSDYEKEFTSAVERTRKWSMDTPDISIRSKPLLTDDKKSAALNVAQKIASEYTAEDISQQCFWYTLLVKKLLEDALESPLYYTLGYVKLNRRNVFYTKETDLKKIIDNPVPGGGGMNLHAWLTTPNMEIIDLTFGTTYGIVTRTSSMIGRCCFQHYTALDENMVYHPQLVGHDYLKRIGALREFML
jgi:hypothetical protein